VVRLTGRQDPLPDLFDAYERTLPRLAGFGPLAWHLRRFERDLLDAIGYALQLEVEADSGEPLAPEGWYRYQVEHGPVACPAGAPRAMRGADLLALAQDQEPDTAGLAALRRLMREVIRFHLGGGELHAWRVLATAMSRRQPG
jgi:DNA repair protein RecO (recombination protein O)